MVSAIEVNPQELIERAATKLKEESLVQPPQWSGYVKTGVHADRPPVDPEWWYARSAALLRSVYKLGPVGTSKLRTKYGGRKNRGNKPEHFYRAGGAIIRNALQQLEKSGLLTQVKTGQRKGRKVTAQGKSFLDKIAQQMLKETKVVKKSPSPKKEQPVQKEEKKVEEKKEAAPVQKEQSNE